MEQIGRNAFLSSAILIQISGAKVFDLSRRIYSIIVCKCQRLWWARKTLQQRKGVMVAARVQRKHDVLSSPPSEPVNALPFASMVERTIKNKIQLFRHQKEAV